MLANLYAKNLALIENLSVDFSSGFNVLTGETGAGKSLILDSMNLFLRNKSGKELIRHGENQLSVSLFFDELDPFTEEKIKALFPEIETGEGIMLSRVISSEGKSSCRVNSRQMPFSSVREIASLLFGINGQNDAIGLQDRKTHIGFLDSSFTEEESRTANEYSSLFGEYSEVSKNIEELKRKDTSPEAREFVEYRIKEIEKAKLKPGEEEALKNKLSEIKDREKINSVISTCNKALSGGEKGKGALYLINAALQKAESCEDDPAFAEIITLLREISEKADRVSFEVAKLADEENAERDAELTEKITHRLDVIYRLTSKYGPTEEDTLTSLEKLKKDLEDMTDSEGRIKELEKEKARLSAKLTDAGEKLSAIRKKKASVLEKRVEGSLRFLDMPKTVFRVGFKKSPDFLPNGIDEAEFMISTNAGEGYKPLCEIASGGELSRVMLAIQTEFGNAKDAPTLVFDEIDTGISGSTSQKIGVRLKKLGTEKQVICVTHSAQVATLADSHFKVSKSETNGRTSTAVTLLDEGEKTRETARILSGEKITDEAIENAKKLYYQGNELYKSTEKEI